MTSAMSQHRADVQDEKRKEEHIAMAEGIAAASDTGRNGNVISLISPIADFDDMLDRGKRNAAISAMPETVMALLQRGSVLWHHLILARHIDLSFRPSCKHLVAAGMQIRQAGVCTAFVEPHSRTDA